jgi:hypothetical protein
VLVGLCVYRRRMADQETSGNGLALAAILMGGLETVTNWLGVTPMIYGLRTSLN